MKKNFLSANMLVATTLFMLTIVISSTASNAQKLQGKYFNNLPAVFGY
jgi:hypothetical protein